MHVAAIQSPKKGGKGFQGWKGVGVSTRVSPVEFMGCLPTVHITVYFGERPRRRSFDGASAGGPGLSARHSLSQRPGTFAPPPFLFLGKRGPSSKEGLRAGVNHRTAPTWDRSWQGGGVWEVGQGRGAVCGGRRERKSGPMGRLNNGFPEGGNGVENRWGLFRQLVVHISSVIIVIR